MPAASQPHCPMMQFGALRIDVQLVQASPMRPQETSVVPGRQLPFEPQHPLHVVGSHWHAPPSQNSPAPQAGPTPHAQLPVAGLHAFEVRVEHARQAAPPLSHCPGVGGLMQELPAQQPVGHEVALQTQLPARHCCPAAHTPPLPQ